MYWMRRIEIRMHLMIGVGGCSNSRCQSMVGSELAHGFLFVSLFYSPPPKGSLLKIVVGETRLGLECCLEHRRPPTLLSLMLHVPCIHCCLQPINRHCDVMTTVYLISIKHCHDNCFLSRSICGRLTSFGAGSWRGNKSMDAVAMATDESGVTCTCIFWLGAVVSYTYHAVCLESSMEEMFLILILLLLNASFMRGLLCTLQVGYKHNAKALSTWPLH